MNNLFQPVKEPKSNKEKADLASKLAKQLTATLEFKEKFAFVQSYLFYWIDKYNLWNSIYGEGQATRNEVLASFKVNINTFFQKRNCYEFFVIKNGFKPEEIAGIDSNSLNKLYIHFNQKNLSKPELKDWLDKARELTRSDLDMELTGKEPCFHLNKEKRAESHFYCRDCNKKLK